MARLVWSHICDHAFLDSNGKPCLIGLFDRIVAPSLPARHRQASLAFRVAGAPQEQVAVRVLLLQPDGETPVVDLSNPRVDLGPAGLHDAIVGLPDLTCPEYGRYAVQIHLNGEPVSAAAFSLEAPPLLQ